MSSTPRPIRRPQINQPNTTPPSGGNTGGSNNQPPKPSPWLNPQQEKPNKNASFVEYLRWMRVKSDDGTIDGGTTIELFQRFENNDYSAALTRLTNRTKKLADECFEAACPWRIRVGGAKGPESMLLPAFDTLGMPYIPSSSFKGVARAIASQDSTITETQVKEIFGDIEPSSSMGQVIFLDAYPLPGNNKQGGLMPDMTNSIWKWEGTTPPKYDTNPNTFLSLKKPTFIIGLRRGAGCSQDTLIKVKQWLIKGLAQGIGSRVNTGYGELNVKGEKPTKKAIILSINFSLEGQLTHGRQTFGQWMLKNDGKGWKPPGKAEVEVRPTAFRSMLRYWFRALAIGVLPNQQARDLEMEIFGGIEVAPDPLTGLFRLEITQEVIKQKNAKDKNDPCGWLEGKLILRNSSQTARLSEQKKQGLKTLLQNLTWLMFHLGGVGQGARRPCYSRQNRSHAPWWRGATLEAVSEDEFWQFPNDLTEFKRQFRQRLEAFYTSLAQFRGGNIDYRQPRTITTPTKTNWAEIIDTHCRIICVTGQEENAKPFALAKLHQLGRKNNNYDPNLCGATDKPSPVWIAQVGSLQVVTIFGWSNETSNPRHQYLEQLQSQGNKQSYQQIFPFS